MDWCMKMCKRVRKILSSTGWQITISVLVASLFIYVLWCLWEEYFANQIILYVVFGLLAFFVSWLTLLSLDSKVNPRPKRIGVRAYGNKVEDHLLFEIGKFYLTICSATFVGALLIPCLNNKIPEPLKGYPFVYVFIVYIICGVFLWFGLTSIIKSMPPD